MPRARRAGDTPRARELGAALRDARLARGLSVRQLADLLGTNTARISRAENGQQPPDEVTTAGFLGALGVTGEQRERLLELARDAADPNWLATGVGRQLGALMEYESAATRISECNPLLIPGLLQTADYARAIMVAGGTPRGLLEQRTALRISRREVLTRRTNPIRFDAFIGEQAVRHAPSPPPVVVDQLHHLLEWGDRPNITVRVVPLGSGWTPMHDGQFVVIEFDRMLPVVHLDHYRSSAVVTDRGDAHDYLTAVDMVRQVAMSPEDSVGLVVEIIKDMEHV